MIYIQSDSERTLPHHFDAACALYGAQDSALDFRLTSFEELASGKFDFVIKNNLFVGSTEFMSEVFKRINLNNIKLPYNSNLTCEISSLSEAKKLIVDNRKIFIKPVELKLFTGFVLDSFDYTCLHGLPEDTQVMIYEPFKEKINSEWRIYILNNQIQDSKNYSGDFKISPDYNYVQWVLNNNKKFPKSYTIDIGILENNQNVVIEFNDMWAIGNYGVPNDLYLRMLKERYFEIINSK